MDHHFDPGWVDRGWWLGGLVLVLMMLLLGALVVWAVVRLSRVGPASASAAAPPPPAPPAPPRDAALEEIRLRYARGEIDRERFQQQLADLGGHVGQAGAATEPGTG